MRQVDRAELIYLLATALCAVPASLWKEAGDPRAAVKQRARTLIATRVAARLGQLEILSSAPAVSENYFTGPLANMLGDDPRSAAPLIDE